VMLDPPPPQPPFAKSRNFQTQYIFVVCLSTLLSTSDSAGCACSIPCLQWPHRVIHLTQTLPHALYPSFYNPHFERGDEVGRGGGGVTCDCSSLMTHSDVAASTASGYPAILSSLSLATTP